MKITRAIYRETKRMCNIAIDDVIRLQDEVSDLKAVNIKLGLALRRCDELNRSYEAERRISAMSADFLNRQSRALKDFISQSPQKSSSLASSVTLIESDVLTYVESENDEINAMLDALEF